MTAFWDSSSLAALCITSQSDFRRRQLWRDHPAVVWWSAAVEISGAIARLGRRGQINAGQTEGAMKRLRNLMESWQEIGPTHDVRETAIEQLQRFPLRAADALQLAAALVWCSHRPARRVFISGDRRLSDCAREIGFTIIET